MVGLVRIVGNINSEFVKHGILTLVILFIGTMVTRFLGRTSPRDPPPSRDNVYFKSIFL